VDIFIPYNPNKLLPKEEIEEEKVQLLPEKIRKLYPCLFLESSTFTQGNEEP